MEKYIEENLQDSFKLWLGRVLIFYAAVHVLSILTDYLLSPENIQQFVIQRAGVIGLIALVLYLLKRYRHRGIRFHYVVAFVCIVVFMALLDIRIYATGGHESKYYLGVLLMGILSLIKKRPKVSNIRGIITIMAEILTETKFGGKKPRILHNYNLTGIIRLPDSVLSLLELIIFVQQEMLI